MLFTTKRLSMKITISLLLLLSLTLFAACSSGSTGGEGSTGGGGEQDMEEMEEGEEMEHEEGEEMEHEHDESERISNDGATIRILSPADGAAFAEGDEIPVAVEVNDFLLDDEGSHWHVYIDGTSWGMVVGGRTEEALRGVEPGQHKIEVYLAGGDHIELADGDSITVTVE
jgi:hypothetical protein